MSINHALLHQEIQQTLDDKIKQFYCDVPYATYQLESEAIQLDYYVRHTIETILRIRHKRMIDALVVHYFTKHDPRAAKKWAQYLEDEMLHGELFAKDLKRLKNITLEEIYAHEPLFSTKLLNGYFYFTLEHEDPMAAIASAYFLEYTTKKTQPAWLDNLEKILGKEATKGARAHVNYDIEENHSSFVWDVLCSLIKKPADIERLHTHLNCIYDLFTAYFIELSQLYFKEPQGKTSTKNCSTLISKTLLLNHT